jgi:hypothetical protein
MKMGGGRIELGLRLLGLAVVAALTWGALAGAQTGNPCGYDGYGRGNGYGYGGGCAQLVDVGVEVSPAAPAANQTVTLRAVPHLQDGDRVAFYEWDLDDDGSFDDGVGETATTSFAEGRHHVAVMVAIVRQERKRLRGFGEATFTVAAPAPAAPAAAAPPAQAAATPPRDVTPPASTLKAPKERLKAALKHGVTAALTCSEACTAALALTLDRGTARKLKLGRKPVVAGRATVTFSGKRTVHIGLSRAARKALGRGHRSVTLKLTGTVTDAAGNRAALPPRSVSLTR